MFLTASGASASGQSREYAENLILIRHMQGIQKSCPCTETSAPPECLDQTTVPRLTPLHTDTYADNDLLQNKTCHKRQVHVAQSRLAAAARWCPPRSQEGKMKRKSERRRAEPRKKRCAAPNSSEVAPNSDIYIEITGKRACGTNPVNFASTWQMRADALGGLRTPRSTFLNDQGVW